MLYRLASPIKSNPVKSRIIQCPPGFFRTSCESIQSAGDRVVTDGIDRLTEGAKVEVVEPQTTVADEKSPSRHEGQKGARA
ncbi:hypothetical protein FQU49_13210 [Salmonella enterica subsp. enterica]|nr:hypothetical protein [Salmonella enterica subsp. enterica serovar Montevideo]